MGKFHIRPDAIDGERVRFDAEEARHLSRVLRLSPGAVIQAIDGTGMEYTVRMEEISPKVGAAEDSAKLTVFGLSRRTAITNFGLSIGNIPAKVPIVRSG